VNGGMDMQAVRFGAITQMVFKNPPQIDWNKAHEDEASYAAAQKLDKEAWGKFNAVVRDHLKQLETQHHGEPDYYAAAVPVSWTGHMLVVDGADLDQFAKDALLEKQRFLSDFEAQVTDPVRRKNIPPSDVDRAKAPLPRTYNWADVHHTGYEYQDQFNRAETANKLRYWEKATKTIDVVI
jgi:hypothetical protein